MRNLGIIIIYSLAALPVSSYADTIYKIIDWESSSQRDFEKAIVSNDRNEFIGFAGDILTIFDEKKITVEGYRYGIPAITTINIGQAGSAETITNFKKSSIEKSRMEKLICFDKNGRETPSDDTCVFEVTKMQYLTKKITSGKSSRIVRYDRMGRVRKFALFLAPKQVITHQDTTIYVKNRKDIVNYLVESTKKPPEAAINNMDSKMSLGFSSSKRTKIEGNFSTSDEFYLNGDQLRSISSPFYIKTAVLKAKENHILIRRRNGIANCRKYFDVTESVKIECTWEVW